VSCRVNGEVALVGKCVKVETPAVFSTTPVSWGTKSIKTQFGPVMLEAFSFFLRSWPLYEPTRSLDHSAFSHLPDCHEKGCVKLARGQVAVYHPKMGCFSQDDRPIDGSAGLRLQPQIQILSSQYPSLDEIFLPTGCRHEMTALPLWICFHPSWEMWKLAGATVYMPWSSPVF
jgi:hypothetical protein